MNAVSSKPLHTIFLALAGLIAGAPLSAQEYVAREVAGWTVAASSDGKGCFLTREYPANGGTTLLFGLDRDGSNHLSVLNRNWSIKPKVQLMLDFRLSNGRYAKHAAVGMEADGKRGFVTDFEAKFPTYLAASKFLYIDRGKVPVERLTLEGSGAAVAELRRCVKAGSAAGQRAGKPSREVPRDPFAVGADWRSRD